MGVVTRIALKFPRIASLNAPVKYTQDLTGCSFDQTLDPPPCVAFDGPPKERNFTNGSFVDMGIPRVLVYS